MGAAPPAWQSKCLRNNNQCESNCRWETEVADTNLDAEETEEALVAGNLEDVFSPCVSGCLARYEGCLYDHQPGYHQPAPPAWQSKCSSQEKQCSSNCRRELLSAKGISASIVRGLAE